MAQTSGQLNILVQPEDFRFRYPGETNHGTLSGKDGKNITVQLEGFSGNKSNVIVLVTIYHRVVDKDGNDVLDIVGNIQMYPHPNLLVKIEGKKVAKNTFYDPIIQSKLTDDTATFPGMIIVRTKKNDINKCLCEKIQRIRKYKPDYMKSINMDDVDHNIFDMHNIHLCFEAFEKCGEEFIPIGKPIYSTKINNSTKPLDGFIWYCYQFVGSSSGGDKIAVVCNYEENNKNEKIKVRFFENRSDNSVWEAYAEITDDIPCPHVLIIKTPPYENVEIEKDRRVFFELCSDMNSTRSPKPFIYKAIHKIKAGKRKKENDDIIAIIDTFIVKGVPEQRIKKVQTLDGLLSSFSLQDFDSGRLKADGKNRPVANEPASSSFNNISDLDKELLKELKRENIFNVLLEENKEDKLNNLLNVIKKYNLEKILQLQNDYDDSCLHIACYFNRVEYLEKLLRLGVDPNLQNNEGNTALHVAVAKKQINCISKILDKQNTQNLNIDLINYKGYTALYLAVLLEEYEIAKTLITIGNASGEIANPTNGNNILHLAIMNINNDNKEKTEDLVRFLLENTSIDLDVENHCGTNSTPLALALEIGINAQNIIELLVK